jgi:hypothetical protein
VLVLDELKVVMPIGDKKPNELAEDSMNDGDSKKMSSSVLLSQMGVTPEFLAMNGIGKRFSGLRINGLEISRLDAVTNVVRVMTARKAELKRAGLELSDSTIMVDGRQENIPKAELKRSKKFLKVVWPTGEFELM